MIPPGARIWPFDNAYRDRLISELNRSMTERFERYIRRLDVTIDTSTTAGKIRVMQYAAENGPQSVELRFRGDSKWIKCRYDDDIYWNWIDYEFRIAPTKTALQRAREQVARDNLGATDSLKSLVAEIDSAVEVTIEHYKFPHYSVGDPSKLNPGRYRLLRDDT